MALKKYPNLFKVQEQIVELIDSLSIEASSLHTLEERYRISRNLTVLVARLNGAIALQPLPLADILFLTPIQVGLVYKIATIYNHSLDLTLAREILKTIVKGVIARSLVRPLTRFVPFLKGPVELIVAYAVTHAVGMAAIRVFENKQDFNLTNVKQNFEKEYKKLDSINLILNTTFSLSHQASLEKLIDNLGLQRLRNNDDSNKKSIFYLPHHN